MLPISDLEDRKSTLIRLESLTHRMSGPSMAWVADSLATAARALIAKGIAPREMASAFFVPGRIEILGKHTDYCGGRSLLVATERGFVFLAVPRNDPQVEMLDIFRGESADFELHADLSLVPGHWSNYPRTVGRRLARNFSEALHGSAHESGSPHEPESLHGSAHGSVHESGSPHGSPHETPHEFFHGSPHGLRRESSQGSLQGSPQESLHGPPRGSLRGASIAFGSNLPPAAGLSTSSAFLIGVFLALETANDLAARPEYQAAIGGIEDLASYLASIENGSGFAGLAGDSGVGTHGGSEDHTAILDSRPSHAGVWSFAPTRLETRIRISTRLVFAVASSGIEAAKTGAAMGRYNRAARLARRAIEICRSHTGTQAPHLAAVLKADPGAAAATREFLLDSRLSRDAEFTGRELWQRVSHFAEEHLRIIPGAASCLEAGDLRGFGRWVDLSQERGAALLGNQVPETIHLSESARRLGAHAASAFGAGFGGSVWALVEEAEVGGFLESWRRTYAERFPEREAGAAFFATRPAGPATRIDV